MSDIKNAVLPATIAKKIGLPVQTSEKGYSMPFDLGVKCVAYHSIDADFQKTVQPLLDKKVAAKDRDGAAPRTIKQFLLQCKELSKVGFLTPKTLREAAGLTQVFTQNGIAGTKAFQKVVEELLLQGCLTEGVRGPNGADEELIPEIKQLATPAAAAIAAAIAAAKKS